MSRFRKVSTGTWGDERFSALTDSAKLLWFYLLTGTETTCLPGLVVIGRAGLAEAMHWEVKKLDRVFSELANATNAEGVPMAKADWRSRVVWLPKGHKHNEPANHNVVKGWRDYWKLVPECDLKREALITFAELMTRKGELFEEAFAWVVGARGANPPAPGSGNDTGNGSRDGVGDDPGDGLRNHSADGLSRASRSPAPSPAPASAPEGVPGGPQPLPPDVALTSRHREVFDALAMTSGGRLDIEHEWGKFVSSAREKGKVSADWLASWDKWLRDAIAYAKRDALRASGGGGGRNAPREPEGPAYERLPSRGVAR